MLLFINNIDCILLKVTSLFHLTRIHISFTLWSSASEVTTLWHNITHTRLTALFPGIPGWAGTRKAKPNWILLKQETVSGSGISWAICKSAPRSRQITMPAPHLSVFYRPDALPAAQPTASKHWRQSKHLWHYTSTFIIINIIIIFFYPR